MPIWFVGKVFHRTKYPDQFIHPIVKRFEVVVTNGPIIADARHGAASKIIGSKTQGDPPPVIGTAAQHPRAEPVKLGSRYSGIGFAFDLPTAPGGIKIAKSPGGACAPTWRLPRVFELGHVFWVGGVVITTRL